MQFVRYNGGSGPTLGVKSDSAIHALADLPEGIPSLQEITNRRYLDQVREKLRNGTLSRIDANEANLLAPVPRPGKIVCAGLNYRDHADEQDEAIPDEPLLFAKAPTTVTNHRSPIVHPPNEKVDYEVELAVVIGRTAKNLEEGEVYDYIAGYTVLNDVSGRSAQFSDDQFFRGKSYDTFSPMGPTLVTGEEYDPNSVDVALRVDGDTKQASNTRQFIFDVPELVSYVSRNMTLRTGDIVSTGTPGGVGIFRDPVDLLEPGQTCEAEIEGIGTLVNPVVGE
ncbi:fumarylacetoacetate hydrolase family protein [Halococcus agarilyticus]|uniref:fumarylacetoacetate hydrolase family protein n=1 Tax=Halococcus agarilyticus TaxID=1232219 RepID=UPI0006775B2E|nr:fumarylacetoacetate hydrolase family protein [Halococcus agarilyticus]